MIGSRAWKCLREGGMKSVQVARTAEVSQVCLVCLQGSGFVLERIAHTVVIQ
jgi:hypothetical protein